MRISDWSSDVCSSDLLALSGSIANGGAVLAAEAMGADFAYVGSAFIATDEANASDAYKQAIVDGAAADIVYTNFFTGVDRKSVVEGKRVYVRVYVGGRRIINKKHKR